MNDYQTGASVVKRRAIMPLGATFLIISGIKICLCDRQNYRSISKRSQGVIFTGASGTFILPEGLFNKGTGIGYAKPLFPGPRIG